MPRSLIVLPDDSAAPIVDAIGAAKRSVCVKMFALSDCPIVGALISARRRGVRVRIMLNPARRSGEVQNTAARQALRDAGIEVIDSNPAFDVTHEKSMVVDRRVALIGSLNWEPKSFKTTRDYAILSTELPDVVEVTECFEADWNRRPFVPRTPSHLIWCPGTGREHIAEFIDTARHTLMVQNERYQDAIVVEHLVRAKLRGVKVHVMTRPSHSLRPEKLVEGLGDLRIMQDVGIGIRKLKRFKLHAKMLLADKTRAIVGSINLTPGTFDRRRELAIQVEEPEILERLWSIAHGDWKHSREVDLTDEGVVADFRKHLGRDSVVGLAQVTSSV